MLNQFNIKTVVLTLAIASPIGAAGAGFNNMYVIGDSLSDQGNLFFATQALTGLGIPADDNYYMGRFANGEIYAGVLANTIHVPLSPSLWGGNNFADGGARNDYNVVEEDASKPFPVSLLGQGGTLPKDAFPWTLKGQVKAFKDREISSDPDALYVVFAGANDLADLTAIVALGLLPPDEIPAYIENVANGIKKAIKAFVKAGAQHILVPNVPNLGVVPAVAINGQVFAGLATSLSAQYNAVLAAKLAKYEGVVNIIPFDAFSLLTAVVAEPSAFGFSNATEPCYTGFVDPAGPEDTVCDNPDIYVFWDKEHPTAAFHAFLAERLLDTIVLDILEDLFQRVDDLDVKAGTKASLNDKLAEAKQVLTDENTNKDLEASTILRAFINSVESKRGNEIPDDAADSLVDSAEKLIQLIEAG
jgi:phospholipase/lecithinase/hemolysin